MQDIPNTDDITAEIEALRAQVTQLQLEYDLDDGQNDEAERAEIENLIAEIEDLEDHQRRIESGEILRLPVTTIESSEMVPFDDSDAQQFFGTRVGEWATECAVAINGVRTELNEQQPSGGFSVSNLFDVIRLIPGTGQLSPVLRAIYNLLRASIEAINVTSGRSFADIGHDVSNSFLQFGRDMRSNTAARQSAWTAFAEAYASPGADTLGPRTLLRSEIETFVAGMPERSAIARDFINVCVGSLSDPLIEFRSGPFEGDEGAAETGYSNIILRYRDGEYVMLQAHFDDAPGALVRTIAREYGRSTSIVDLPFPIQCSVMVYWGPTLDLQMTTFNVHRASRTPGNRSFAFENTSRGEGEERDAVEAALAAFRANDPFSAVTAGQLQGE